MSKTLKLQRRALFGKIRIISNEYRFKILELTDSRKMSITRLSSSLNLSYTKCADYVSLLEKAGLVQKTRAGKEVLVESKVDLGDSKIRFG